jgi:uncharacterized GH25 family protein
MTPKLFLAAGLLSVSTLAQAHFPWLERAPDGVTNAYFGEWADDLRETQQGPLKILATATVTQDGKVLEATAHDDHFAYSSSGSADVRLAHTLVHGDTRVLFTAKSGRSETKAASDFELVPATANGDTFTVLFQGKPLAQAEVVVFGPPKWSKTLYSDDKGQVTLPLPWSGQYVVEVAHVIDGKGELDGKPYQKTRHVSTLAFVK